jgi:hypothetical protein
MPPLVRFPTMVWLCRLQVHRILALGKATVCQVQKEGRAKRGTVGTTSHSINCQSKVPHFSAHKRGSKWRKERGVQRASADFF